ncbi:MAG TPA: cytochrome c biogenesis protein CcsA [Pyrinomonadaceae bacterium]|nr:cytochrome c biogenesis protein CcsA [Pyrinomonadaceae bacterium]
MKPLLLMTLAAYVVAAVHYVVAFMHKRRSSERVAFMSLAVGFALHTASIITDWVEDNHYPLFGLRETFSFLAWTLVVAYLLTLVLTRYRTLALGSFTLPLVSVLTFIAMIARDKAAGSSSQITTAGGGSWLFPVHTTLLLFAYAAFFVVFAASVMYLVQERELRNKTFSAFFHRLPSLMTVNDIATHAAGIGFTLLTLGVLTGMLWSTERDGRLWHNDPKEIFAGITWLLYLVLILYRSTANWRGRRAAWLGVIGFALVLCTFFGARLLGSYHVFGFWILDFGFWIGGATNLA